MGENRIARSGCATKRRDALRYCAYVRALAAGAQHIDTGGAFCRFDGVIGEGENDVHDASGARLRLFSRRRVVSRLRGVSGVDELAGGGWFGGFLRGVSGLFPLEITTRSGDAFAALFFLRLPLQEWFEELERIL